MIPKIKPEQLENKFFTIKGTTNIDTTVMFVDFQYSPGPSMNLLNNNASNLNSIPTISPNVYQKTFHLNSLTFTNIDINLEIIQNELYKEYFKILSELGDQHREKSPAKNFDINVSEMRRKGMAPDRGIIAKFNSASNLIAVEGRIGPAQFIVSNSKTYNYILNYIGQMQFLYKGNELWIGNMPYVIDENVENNKILLSRKNRIDQPGIHCAIMVDEEGYILFQEIVNPNNFETKLVMNFCVDSVGFHPHYQVMKIDTRSIAYYRNQKLLRIKQYIDKNN